MENKNRTWSVYLGGSLGRWSWDKTEEEAREDLRAAIMQGHTMAWAESSEGLGEIS